MGPTHVQVRRTWDQLTCKYAAVHERWDCFQYLVDNKCPGWEKYAERYAEHLR